MNRNQAAILIYGVLYIAMGVDGFIAKGSMKSMMSGGTIGVLEIALAAYSKTNPSIGYRAAAGLAVLAGLAWPIMAAVLGTGMAFYPHYVGMILSFGLAIFLLAGHFLARKKSHDGSIDPKA